MNSIDLINAMISLAITFTIGAFIVIQIYITHLEHNAIKEYNTAHVTPQKVKKQKQKNQNINNLNGDGFYNKLMAMHEMKAHHTLCENILSNTTVKMNLSLDEIIKIRSYIRVADHRMRKYMKKAAPHPYGEVLQSIYHNYDNAKIWTRAS